MNFTPSINRTASRILPAFAIPVAFGLAASSLALPATAQEMVSRPVVQVLESEEVQDLSTALKQLARRPRDLSALVAAGKASLAVDDLEAAIGFFRRAEEVSPQDARVKLGLASVYLRSGRPVQALELFESVSVSNAAIRNGGGSGSSADYDRDQGLAYDLVGDAERAQTLYKAALARDDKDTETVRRLAISKAIEGDRAGFEGALRPLLEKNDTAAFRARAFGLAIMGDQARAATIVNEVMPRDLASRLTPYLAFMPRLTRSQQAAAANLGIFPRAADIGREDPEIAKYRENGGVTLASRSDNSNGVDARLAPAGAPLGQVAAAGPANVDAAADPIASRPVAPEQASNSPKADPAIPGASGPTIVYSTLPANNPPTKPANAAPAPTRMPTPTTSVADAFADIEGGSGRAGRRADAVDLDTIEVPREARAETEPAKPAAPRRYWVQVATGRDISALRFDWRRIKRAAPNILGSFEAYTTPWGEANRLLAGPVESAKKARAMVNDLKGKGLDTFTYTSPEGAEVSSLTGS